MLTYAPAEDIQPVSRQSFTYFHSFPFILGIDNCSRDQKSLEMSKELNKMAAKKAPEVQNSAKESIRVVGEKTK